jgi:RNA polymerase sigma-70 factor (ECF subfamily)
VTGVQTEGNSTTSAQMKADLIAIIPNLRAFAVSLCGNPDRADDLVQETLVKAWSNLGSFVEGTNLPAWLFTILRNIYYSEYRKRRREVADSDGAIAAKLATAPAQNGHMDLLDFRAALQQLPNDQREALILIGASGLSYEEAAQICNCAVGTMKSRVNRARISVLSGKRGSGLTLSARLGCLRLLLPNPFDIAHRKTVIANLFSDCVRIGYCQKRACMARRQLPLCQKDFGPFRQP